MLTPLEGAEGTDLPRTKRWVRIPKRGNRCPSSDCSLIFPPCPVPNPLLGDPEWLFSGFCFLAAVFLFSLPLSLPFALWLLSRLSSSVYPPRLCRASPAADPPLAGAREMKRQSLGAPAVCTVSWAPRKCLTPSVETEYFLL